MTTRDQVEADWLLEHGRTPEEMRKMQAAARPESTMRVENYVDPLLLRLDPEAAASYVQQTEEAMLQSLAITLRASGHITVVRKMMDDDRLRIRMEITLPR